MLAARRQEILVLLLALAAIALGVRRIASVELWYDRPFTARAAERVGMRFLEVAPRLPAGVDELELLCDRAADCWRQSLQARFALAPRLFTPANRLDGRRLRWALADLAEPASLPALAAARGYTVQWTSADGRLALLSRSW